MCNVAVRTLQKLNTEHELNELNSENKSFFCVCDFYSNMSGLFSVLLHNSDSFQGSNNNKGYTKLLLVPNITLKALHTLTI